MTEKEHLTFDAVMSTKTYVFNRKYTVVVIKAGDEQERSFEGKKFTTQDLVVDDGTGCFPMSWSPNAYVKIKEGNTYDLEEAYIQLEGPKEWNEKHTKKEFIPEKRIYWKCKVSKIGKMFASSKTVTPSGLSWKDMLTKYPVDGAPSTSASSGGIPMDTKKAADKVFNVLWGLVTEQQQDDIQTEFEAEMVIVNRDLMLEDD